MKYPVLILAFALTGCSKKGPEQAFVPPPVPVHLSSVELRDVPLFFEAIGVVKPSQAADVKPQVSGMIKKVHFNEGEWVDEGALLYTIDDGLYTIKVQEVKAQLFQDQANLINAKKKLERYKSLTKRDWIAAVEWDELETRIALNEAAVAADEARLAGALRDLEHCQIKAPIAGKTGKSALGVGNLVQQGASLVNLVQADPLAVDFSITEKELLLITSKEPQVQIYHAGSTECIANGSVTFMDLQIDQKSGMLAASAKLSSVAKPLRPGQTVRVHLFYDNKQNAKLIPMRAIKTNQDGPYLFTVKEDNTVEIRSIKLGPEENGLIVVEEGLTDTDKVVTEGHSRLFPGAKVEAVK